MSEFGNVVSVSCAACATVFTFGVCGPAQAADCACDYIDGVVRGHYGSKFDVTRIDLGFVPVQGRLDPVCDACVDGWIAAAPNATRDEYFDWQDGEA